MKFVLLIAFGIAATQAEQSQVLKDFSVGYTQFTADIYKELLTSNSGNFLVCPLSVNVILALTSNGARGNTAKQLATSLHLPEDREKVKQIFKELAPHLQGNDKYTLTSANKIYLKKGYDVFDNFKDTAVGVFRSDIQNIDFLQKEAAVTEMNKWIEEQTHDKIKDIIKQGDLSDDTFAVLINAIYFHGQWKTQFKAENTRKRTFHASSKKDTQIDMMEVTENFKYFESRELNAQFVELPYDGDDVTMTFVLPNDIEGLPTLEAHLADVITAPTYQVEKVQVVIPKFKSESTIQFKPIFQALGVDDAFEDYADFSGLTEKRTKISKIIQKVFIEVEEKGTTAAAATVVVQNFIRSGLSVHFPPKQFIADHPFIYYLKGPAGVMFIGRYVQG